MFYDLIYGVIEEFVGEHYGETPDDACYNLEALANEVSEALTEKKVISELSFIEKRKIFDELQDDYYAEDIKSQLDQIALDDDADLKALDDICPEGLVDVLKRNIEHNDPYWDAYWEIVNYTINEEIKARVRSSEEKGA